MAVTVVMGPPGPPGQSAGAAGSFEYDSGPTAIASHVINHNLGFKPNVSAFIRGTNQPIIGVTIHHSINQLEIVFNSPQAIVARLS